MTAIDKVTSDTDLDGVFEATDFAKATNQTLNVEGTSNRLLGLNQTTVTTNNNLTKSVVTTPVTYTVDANGAMTSDGLRTFDYDASNRMTKVKVYKDGEAASISYLHNASGQRVFKGEPTAEQTLPNETALGTSFVDWLKKNFSWLCATAQANTSIGTAYIYGGDNEIPAWALLGEHDNGSSKGAGRTEYIWMPTEDGSATPIGLYRGGQFYALHTDHLGTARLMTNEANKPVWQWPYSAFGQNKPTGVLKATANPKAAITNRPVLLQATTAPEMNLGFPGQMRDVETGAFYNALRDAYDPLTGRYRQPDSIGMAGGLSRFGYARQNPLKLADPWGLRPLTPQEKALLDPYIPAQDLDNADIHTGEMPSYALNWAAGITRGNDIYFRDPKQTFCTPQDVALLGHELVHVGQYRQGMTWLSYLWANRNGYDKNPYEINAYELQRKMQSELQNKDCSCKD